MNSPLSKFSFQNIWITFKRGFRKLWWLLMLLVIIGGAATGYLAYEYYTPRYTASATFTVRVDNSVYSGNSSYNSQTAKQLEKTFPYILTSGVLSDIVKDNLGVDKLPAITANAIEDANILELKVTGTDPKFCHRVLQSVIKNYPAIAERVVGPTDMTVIDATGIPSTPDNPRDWKTPAVKGAFVGAILGALFVFAYGLIKATIIDRDDFQRISNADYLGALPVVVQKKRTNAKEQIISLKTVNSRNYRDAFRTVAARVNKALKHNNYHVLVVSSAIPGEGKTTVSFNLAAALAETRKRVLIIDCDLRNPSLYRMLKQEECDGVTEWFNGEAQLWESIHYIADYKLNVLFAGHPTDDSAEILGSDKFKEMLVSLRQKYDVIILDTPPCSMLADAAELSTQADCFLMVVKQDYASRDSVVGGLNNMQESALPIIGYVLNEYEGGTSGRYGYGQYGYGKYGYGKYGYGKYGYGQETAATTATAAAAVETANAVAEKSEPQKPAVKNNDVGTAAKQQKKTVVQEPKKNTPKAPAKAENNKTKAKNNKNKADGNKADKPKELVDLSDRQPVNNGKKQKNKNNDKSKNNNKDTKKSSKKSKNGKKSKKNKKNKKMSKGAKCLVIIASVLAGIALLLVLTVAILSAVGKNAMTNDGGIDASAIGATNEDGGTIRYKGKLYKYNKDISSVLLIGVDDADKETAINGENENGSQSDVNVLAVLDPDSEKLTFISISRDTICEIEVFDTKGNSEGMANAQLALSYSYGDGAEGSCELTTDAVSKIFYDLDIPAYGSIYMNGIVDIVDNLGGITITNNGKDTKLNGTRTKDYIQHRAGTIEGNNERMQRQSQVIKALVHKIIDKVKANPKSILDIYDVVKNNTTTNLNAAKMVYLAWQATKLDFDGDIKNVPGHSELGEQNHAEYIIDEEAFFDLILQTFYTPVK